MKIEYLKIEKVRKVSCVEDKKVTWINVINGKGDILNIREDYKGDFVIRPA